MTAKYSKLQIEEVLKAARIEEIVGDYINLRHSGKGLPEYALFTVTRIPPFPSIRKKASGSALAAMKGEICSSS